MSIQNELDQIKNAIYGKDVRQAIHDGIEMAYNDAATDHDNANMEVKLARGSSSTLGERLNEIDVLGDNILAKDLSQDGEIDNITTQLAQKITQGVGAVTQADLSQSVKESITGGSVAVVGTDGVNGRENIVDNTITPNKLHGGSVPDGYNLISPYDYYLDKSINDTTGVISDGNDPIFKDFPVKQGVSYTTLGNTIRKVVQYDSDGVFQGKISNAISAGGGSFTATHDGVVAFQLSVSPPNYFTVVETDKYAGVHLDYKRTNDHLLLTPENIEVGSIDNSKIKPNSIGVDEVDFISKGSNLFNKHDIYENVLPAVDGFLPINGYFASQEVRFSEETPVTAKYCRQYVVKDSYGNAVESANTGDSLATITVNVPTNGTIQIGGSIAYLDLVQMNKGTTLLPFEPYKETLRETIRISRSQVIENVEVGDLTVERDGSLITIIGRESGNVIKHTMDLTGSKNGSFRFVDVTLNGETIHTIGDDITPIRTVSTVGANHGYTESVVGANFPNNMSSGQLYPSIKNIEQRIIEKKESISITESYEILDHESLLSWKENNPTLDYVEYLDDIESAVKLITRYTFYGFGKCNVETSIIILKSVPTADTGFLQSNPLSAYAKRYMPGVTVSGHDFQNGVDLSTYTTSNIVRASDLTNVNEPPLFYTDVKNNVHYSMGYIPEQNAENTARLTQTERFWDLRSTGKSYPIAVDDTSSPLEAGTIFQVSGFRNYTIDEKDLITFEVVDSGANWYVYVYSVNAQGVLNRPVDIPSDKLITPIVNNGVTLLNDKTGGGGITFSTEVKGYGVFKIEK